MNDIFRKHTYIATVLALVGLIIILIVSVTHYRTRNLEVEIRKSINSERSEMLNLAEITDRNGADEITSAVIVDCMRRNEYESLLSHVSNLDAKNLLMLQNLHEACGQYYVSLKALTVMRLEREYETFDSLIALLSTLTTHDTDDYKQNVWKELLSFEKMRSSLMVDQQKLQSSIISELLNGSSVRSANVVALSNQAQEISELLSVYNKEIDTRRETLKN